MKHGRASETAARIAINAVAASLDPELRRLLPDPSEPYSEWFVQEHSPEARQQLALWRSGAPVMRVLSDAIEPGGALFVLVRKLWIEDRIGRALDDGVDQVAVLGAGYDVVGLRLACERPSVRFFELDHPDTQAVKRRALEAHQAMPEGLTLLPLDLAAQPVAPALAAAGWAASRPGVIVAEGVLMYLDAAQVDRSVSSIAEALAGGGRFLFTLMDKRLLEEQRGHTARTAKLLAASGEPIRSSLEPEVVGPFLEARGFRLRSVVGHRQLKEAYLLPRGIERPLSEGEFLVEAEVAP